MTRKNTKKRASLSKRAKGSLAALLSRGASRRAVRNTRSSTRAQTKVSRPNRKIKAVVGEEKTIRVTRFVRNPFVLPQSGLARAVAVVSLGALLWWGGRSMHERASTSDSFRIDSVRIDGAHRASKEEIEALAGVEIGENLIAVDVDAVRGFIAQHPWVRSVEVRRALPHELVIEVEEHEPVALIALGHLYYVNSRGEIVKRRASEERELLPIVTGFEREDIEKEETNRRAQLTEVIGFLETSRTVLGEQAPVIAELHYDPSMGLSFVSEGDDVRIHVGQPPWEPQLRRFAKVRAALRQKGLEATEITLGGVRRPERVVARLEGSRR